MKTNNKDWKILAAMVAVLFLSSCSLGYATWRIASSDGGGGLPGIKSREDMAMAPRVSIQTDDPRQLLSAQMFQGNITIRPEAYTSQLLKRLKNNCRLWAHFSGLNPDRSFFYGSLLLRDRSEQPLCATTEPMTFKQAEGFCRGTMGRTLVANQPLTNTVVCGHKLNEQEA